MLGLIKFKDQGAEAGLTVSRTFSTAERESCEATKRFGFYESEPEKGKGLLWRPLSSINVLPNFRLLETSHALLGEWRLLVTIRHLHTSLLEAR